MIRIAYKSYSDIYHRKSLSRAIWLYYFNNEFKVLCNIRRILYTKNTVLKNIYIRKTERKYSVKIGRNVCIGKHLTISHYNGIVIGDNVRIGDHCTIYHQVTIGQKNNKYPVIGNNVVMYPGCKIIGDISVGNNSIIAPNAVVIHDVPENAVVAGVPAKIIAWRN